MSITLARWDLNGSSEGWWLVREMSGVFLFSLPGGWAIDNDPAILAGFEERTREVWGDSWEAKSYSLGSIADRIYKTRQAAVLALEVELSSPSSSLAEALC